MSALSATFGRRQSPTVLTLSEYLQRCKTDRLSYASAAERMLAAIGQPQMVDTAKDARLGRIFGNRTIRLYPAFKDFYGMEEAIERIVGFFRNAAQGLEERKQILYLLGPVGGGKSSIAERLKSLMEKNPIFVLAVKCVDKKSATGMVIRDQEGVDFELSPYFESPLGLFDPELDGPTLQEQYGIPRRRLTSIPSPWALKRQKDLQSFDDFYVVQLQPSKLEQIAIAKTEPGDDNNQDIASLVGKVDIRKIERFGQNDPDAYAASGGLNRANQGLLEFVEMFKAPIKMLHPLLTATQESNYNGTENIGAIPFNGIVLAHSNEAEWATFKRNKNNEAFIDRVALVKVSYCLRYADEERIYRKMLDMSELADAPCAPKTLEMLAQILVMSRLKKHESSDPASKMRVYNGDDVKHKDPKAKTIQEYRDAAGQDEGMDGLSTRFGFKVLSDVFNYDAHEVAADPVHMMYILEKSIVREQFPKERENELISMMKTYLRDPYKDFIGKEIQEAYLESAGEFGQNRFDRYIEYADKWVEDQDYRDPDTGEMYDREALDKELGKIEKPAGIANPRDFRNEVVKFVLRYRSENGGRNPSWHSYEKMKEVIEKGIFANLEEMLPVISFGQKPNSDTQAKHTAFVVRMQKKGYTPSQVQRLVEWYRKASQS